MIKIEAALISLVDSESLADLDGDKIFVNRAPQDAVIPYCVINRVSTVPVNIKGDTSPKQNIRLQFSMISNNLIEASNMGDQLKGVIDGIVNVTSAGVVIDHVRFDDENYLFNDETDLHLVAIDYICKVSV